MAASEQSEITVCDVTFFYNVTFNVNIEVLKIAALEPTLSIE